MKYDANEVVTWVVSNLQHTHLCIVQYLDNTQNVIT